MLSEPKGITQFDSHREGGGGGATPHTGLSHSKERGVLN